MGVTAWAGRTVGLCFVVVFVVAEVEEWVWRGSAMVRGLGGAVVVVVGCRFGVARRSVVVGFA